MRRTVQQRSFRGSTSPLRSPGERLSAGLGRRFKLCLALGVALMLGGTLVGAAIGAAPAQARASLSFYSHAPSGWQQRPVGTLLKWQRSTATWPCLAGLRGYRVMYVSRGALGEKVFETGMVYLPAGHAPSRGGYRVMVWDHGTSGVGDGAAPSRYAWLYPEPVSTAWDWYAQWVGKLGRMGYVVACPDYEGMGTPGLATYLNAASEGRATIDAVRAARALAARLGEATSIRWGVSGHSQGGQAALAAAEMASTYGKGLSLRATIAFAPAVDLQDQFPRNATNAVEWPYIGYVAWGIKAIDPTFDVTSICGPWLAAYVDQAPADYFDQWWNLLIPQHLDGDGNPVAPQMGDALLADWQDGAAVQSFLEATRVDNRKASGPVLLLQGTDDDFYQTFPEFVGTLTALGDDLQVVALPGQDHDNTLPFGWPWAKAFLEDRLPAR